MHECLFPIPWELFLEWYARVLFDLFSFSSSIQVFNAPQRPTMPLRPPAQMTALPGGMQPSMRFNLGTLPYTFMQMGPEGITLNQVSASVVADVQTGTSPSSQEQQQSPNNRPIPCI